MTRVVFTGFPADTLQFLRSLKRNNNREWFQKHKSAYEQSVKRPMENLIIRLSLDFADFAPEMVANPKVSAYRIYRDTRFSADKTPYKTHVAAVFPRRGFGKHEGAGFYFHLAPEELLIAGGLYMPAPEGLNVLRFHIAENFDRFRAIVESRQFKKLFGRMTGEQLTRVPRGFRADHPAAGYLRYRQFLAGRTFDPDVATTPELHRRITETFRGMLPFIRFLNEPLVRLASLQLSRRSASYDDFGANP